MSPAKVYRRTFDLGFAYVRGGGGGGGGSGGIDVDIWMAMRICGFDASERVYWAMGQKQWNKMWGNEGMYMVQ